MKESVLAFGPAGALVGVLTRPPGWEPGAGSGIAVILLNSGVIHRVGPNRLHVQLARTLAARGAPCLRVDLPGIGDSRPLGTGGALLDEWVSGTRAAMDALEQRGVASRFVLFGLCSGADRAFSAACADSRVVGMALVDPTGIFPTWQSKVLRGARWLRRPAAWRRLLIGDYRITERVAQWMKHAQGARATVEGTSPPPRMSLEEGRRVAEQALRGLVQRGVRICYVVTASQEHRFNYRGQLFHAFPNLGLEDLVRVELFSDAQHTLPREVDRRRLQETVAHWLDQFIDGAEPGGEDHPAAVRAEAGGRRAG